jgi:hypothetical protein
VSTVPDFAVPRYSKFRDGPGTDIGSQYPQLN